MLIKQCGPCCKSEFPEFCLHNKWAVDLGTNYYLFEPQVLFSTWNVEEIIFALLTCKAVSLKRNWPMKSLTWFPLFPWDVCSFLERKGKWDHRGTKRCAKGQRFPWKTFWLLETPECWGISISSQLQAYPAPGTGPLRWEPWCQHPQPRLPTAQLWKSGVSIHSICPLVDGF